MTGVPLFRFSAVPIIFAYWCTVSSSNNETISSAINKSNRNSFPATDISTLRIAINGAHCSTVEYAEPESYGTNLYSGDDS